jgi:hypothetical protein
VSCSSNVEYFGYSVEFSSASSLGIQLSDDFVVLGLVNNMQAQRSGKINVGDKLISVNGNNVEGLPFADAANILRRAPLPKVLQFSTSVPPSLLEIDVGSKVHLQFGAGNLFLGDIKAVFAKFGSQQSCKFRSVVAAVPEDGCSALSNAAFVRNKFLVVRRGNCDFISKLRIAQDFGASGLVVINDGPHVFQMPSGDTSTGDLFAPAVMVSAEDGESVLGHLLTSSNLHARLYSEDECGEEPDFSRALGSRLGLKVFPL